MNWTNEVSEMDQIVLNNKKTESDAIDEVMIECRKCEVDRCLKPCGTAKAILSKYNLEYKG